MAQLKIDIHTVGTEEVTKEDISTLAYYADKVTTDSDIVGNVHAAVAYANDTVKLRNRYPNLIISVDKEGIGFADKEVERVLIASTNPKIDTDGDGMISLSEAESATSIPTFNGNNAVIEFTELKFFKNVSLAQYSQFSYCSNLRKLTFPTTMTATPNGVSEYSGVCAHDENLEYVDLQNIETIGDYAFYASGTNSVFRISHNGKLRVVKYNAFYAAGTSGLDIDLSTIEEIGVWGFMGVEFTNDTLNLPKLKSLGKAAFTGNYLGQNTSVKHIVNLGSITELLQYNGNFTMFQNYKALEDVVLPATLTKMEYATFGGCTSLQRVVCKAVTPPELGNYVFSGCPLSEGIYVPDASVDAYKAAAGWSTYASKIKPLSSYTGEL